MKIKSYWFFIKDFSQKKFKEWEIEKKFRFIYEKRKNILPFLNQVFQIAQKASKSAWKTTRIKSIQIYDQVRVLFLDYKKHFVKFLKKSFFPFCKKIFYELEKESVHFFHWSAKKIKNIIFWVKAIHITAKMIKFALKSKAALSPKIQSIGRSLSKAVKAIWRFLIFLKNQIIHFFLFLKAHLGVIFSDLSLDLEKTYPLVQQKAQNSLRSFFYFFKKGFVFLKSKIALGYRAYFKKTGFVSAHYLKKSFLILIRVFLKAVAFTNKFYRFSRIIFGRFCAIFFQKILRFFAFISFIFKRLFRFFPNFRLAIQWFNRAASFLTLQAVSITARSLKAVKSIRLGLKSLGKALFFVFKMKSFLFFLLISLKKSCFSAFRYTSKRLLAFFRYFLKIFKISKLCIYQTRKAVYQTKKTFFFLRNLNRLLYTKILFAVNFCIKTSRGLIGLFILKKVLFIRFHSSFSRFKHHFHFNLHSFFKLHVLFLRHIITTNWIRIGYQLAIFLVVSLTVFTLSRADFDWSNNRKPVSSHFAEIPQTPKEYKKEIRIYVDIADGNLKRIVLDHLKNFEIVSLKKNADAIASEKPEKNFVSVMVEGTAFIIHKNNPLLNISAARIQEILSGKITDWAQLGGKPKKIQILADIESIYQPQFNFTAASADKILKKAENEEDVLGILAVKNLFPSSKILMVDYHYPSKSEMIIGHYPFARFVVLNFKDNIGIEKEQVFHKISGGTLRSVVAGGDVMWDRGVSGRIKQSGTDFLIQDLAPFFKTGDISILNLETSISQRGSRYNLDKGIFFRSDPRHINLLTDMSINLVSLANNHAFDYGMTAILDTVDYLTHHKIKQVGFGRDNEEAIAGPIYEFGGKKLRFISYNTVYPNNVSANANQPGIMMINPATLDNEIRQAKKGVDYLILLMHSGEEYSFYPESYKIGLYRKLVDLGADIIIGSHPHVIQSFEFYKGKPIIYSVGNLIFDQYRFPNTREEIVMELNFYNGRLTYLFPHFFSVNSEFKPQLVKNPEVEKLQARMARLQNDIVRITRTIPKKDITGNVPMFNTRAQNEKAENNKPPVKAEVLDMAKNPVDEEKLEDSQYKEAEEKMPALFSEENIEN